MTVCLDRAVAAAARGNTSLKVRSTEACCRTPGMQIIKLQRAQREAS